MITTSKRTKRLIIVVWYWDKSILDPLPGRWDHDYWISSAKDTFFVRAACTKYQTPYTLLAGIVDKYLAVDGEAMILLHESSPHAFDRASLHLLSREIRLPGVCFRLRLFGNKHGPIYMSYAKLGILGLDGNFPNVRNVMQPDGHVVKEPSGFVIDRDKKLLNADHLTYLWSSYWHTPLANFKRLNEEFHAHAGGFYAQQEDPPRNLSGYLQQQPALWHKLLQLAHRDDLGTDENLLKIYSEYRADNYTDYLGTPERAELAKQIFFLSSELSTILDESTPDPMPPLERIVYLQATFSNILIAIPANLL